MPLQIPETPERCPQPQRTAAVAGRLEPAHGSPEVVVVALQPVEPVCVAPHSDQVGFCLFGETEKVLRVAIAKRRGGV